MPPATTSAGIKGVALILTIDGTDRAVDMKSYELSHGESDNNDITFGETGAGISTATLKFTAIQSTDPASAWVYIWNNSGKEVAFKIAPHGNTAASTTQPFITGKTTIGPKPTLGGEAAARGERFTFEAEWSAKVDPALVVTGNITTA